MDWSAHLVIILVGQRYCLWLCLGCSDGCVTFLFCRVGIVWIHFCWSVVGWKIGGLFEVLFLVYLVVCCFLLIWWNGWCLWLCLFGCRSCVFWRLWYQRDPNWSWFECCWCFVWVCSLCWEWLFDCFDFWFVIRFGCFGNLLVLVRPLFYWIGFKFLFLEFWWILCSWLVCCFRSVLIHWRLCVQENVLG